jgi:murein DD-endopeptidase MepM/ murein hydrolase activator NlpD
MHRALLPLCVAAAVLAGCDREPIRTIVVKPASAPAAAEPPAAALPPAPAALPPLGPASAVPPSIALPKPEPELPSIPNVASPRAAAQADADGAALLAQRRLIVPVEGVRPAALIDTYEQGRGDRKHEAIDIAAARGTLFNSVPGGLTVYQFDRAGQLSYYYAHLDRYAEGLKEGQFLKRGDLVGYVGSTGNASPEVPHLHFAVFRLGPDRKWWKGDPVNPYPALRQAQG